MGSDVTTRERIDGTYVSIHAPTWGATVSNGRIAWEKVFQSTLPHGERQLFGEVGGREGSFNPRSHMGSDSLSFLHS